MNKLPSDAAPDEVLELLLEGARRKLYILVYSLDNVFYSSCSAYLVIDEQVHFFKLLYCVILN